MQNKISKERGCHIKLKKYDHFKSLLEEWSLLIDRYCRISKVDAPYWYNERANVGLIAGAAWRCGWLSLEEFQIGKRRGRKKYSGRCDLWLQAGSKEYIIEAKFKETSLNSKNTGSITKDVLTKVSSNVKSSDIDEEMPLGMVFMCPYITKRQSDKIDDKISSMLRELKKSDPDVLGWCFPDNSRRLETDDGFVYPGIIVLINGI